MTFDLAVIGGGVVGCALFRRFALGGLKTLLLERAPDILAGASKANSAMLHTGFDAPTGSLEQACIQAGHGEYLAIRGPLNLPLLESGGLMAAWNAEELARLPAVVAQAHANGVSDVRQIDAPSPPARASSRARCGGGHRAARASDRSLVRALAVRCKPWRWAARSGAAVP
jgi:L-2-hydroxyglutarate oxidase LhgO